MAQQEKKGWFGGLFASKPAKEVITDLSGQLDIRVAVTAKGPGKAEGNLDPVVTFTAPESVIGKIEKSLAKEGIQANHRASDSKISFVGEEVVGKLTKVLDRVKRGAGRITFEPLKERISDDEMEGLTSQDFHTMNHQSSPSIDMVSSIAKLVVRDKEDATGITQKKQAAAKKLAAKQAATQKTSKAAAGSSESISDQDIDSFLDDLSKEEGQGESADKATTGKPASKADASDTPEPSNTETSKKAAPSSSVSHDDDEMDFEVDDDMGFYLNTEYDIKMRKGPGGGLVIAVPASTDEQTWIDEAREIRQAIGDSGVVTVQRYQNPKTDSKGYVIAGVDADRLVKPDATTVTKDNIMRRIRVAALAEQRYVETGTPQRTDSAKFSLPDDLSEERREGFIQKLQASFGEKGDQYVKAYETADSPPKHGVKVIGTTREALGISSDGNLNGKELRAKLAEAADAIRENTPLKGEMPDTSKSVVLNFPKDLPQERRDQYIRQVRSLYEENGSRIVRSYRSRSDLEKTGIKIVGVTKEEILHPEQKSIGNVAFLKKLNSIVNESHAEVATSKENEPPAGAVVLSSDSKEMVAEFVKELRQTIVKTQQEQQKLKDEYPDRMELHAKLQEHAKSVQSSMHFPEDSKMLQVRNIDRSPDEMQALRSALVEEGFTGTAIVGSKNLYIGMLPAGNEGHASRIVNAGDAELAEKNLRDLLSRGFRDNEIDQLVERYQNRNQSKGVQISGS